MDIEKVWLRWTKDVENKKCLLINLYWFLKYRSLGLYAPRYIGKEPDAYDVVSLSKDIVRKQLEHEIALSNGNMIWKDANDSIDGIIIDSALENECDGLFAFFINDTCTEIDIAEGAGDIFARWYYMRETPLSKIQHYTLRAGIVDERLKKRLSLIGSEDVLMTDGIDDVEVVEHTSLDMIQNHKNYAVTSQRYEKTYSKLDIDISKCTFKDLSGIKCDGDVWITGNNKYLRYIRFTDAVTDKGVNIAKDIKIEQCERMHLTEENCKNLKRLVGCYIIKNGTFDLSNADYIDDLFITGEKTRYSIPEVTLDFGNKYVIFRNNEAIINKGYKLKIRYSNQEMTDALSEIVDNNKKPIELEYTGE